jgi:mannose-6-phosphate isomerase-like protein (cupin superfamily)
MDKVKMVPLLPLEKNPDGDYYERHIVNVDRLAMSVAVVMPGKSVPPHTHQNEEQTYYILRGRGQVVMGGEKFDLAADSAIYIPRGVEHSTHNTGDQVLEYIWFSARV